MAIHGPRAQSMAGRRRARLGALRFKRNWQNSAYVRRAIGWRRHPIPSLWMRIVAQLRARTPSMICAVTALRGLPPRRPNRAPPMWPITSKGYSVMPPVHIRQALIWWSILSCASRPTRWMICICNRLYWTRQRRVCAILWRQVLRLIQCYWWARLCEKMDGFTIVQRLFEAAHCSGLSQKATYPITASFMKSAGLPMAALAKAG